MGMRRVQAIPLGRSVRWLYGYESFWRFKGRSCGSRGHTFFGRGRDIAAVCGHGGLLIDSARLRGLAPEAGVELKVPGPAKGAEVGAKIDLQSRRGRGRERYRKTQHTRPDGEMMGSQPGPTNINNRLTSAHSLGPSRLSS